MSHIENAKKDTRLKDTPNVLHLPTPWPLKEKYGSRFRSPAFADACERLGLEFDSDRCELRIKPKFMRRIHKPIVNDIVKFMDRVLDEPQLHDCKLVILVGGFANSVFVQDAVTRAATARCAVVITPKEAQVCVLKGAVMFGHNMTEVSARIARYTYGQDIATPFDPDIHDPTKVRVYDGVEFAYPLFRTIIERGTEVRVGQTIESQLWPVEDEQTEMKLKFYVLDGLPTDVQYADAPNVRKIATRVVLPMPDTTKKDNRPVDASYRFGGTEIEVELCDNESGHTERSFITLTGE